MVNYYELFGLRAVSIYSISSCIINVNATFEDGLELFDNNVNDILNMPYYDFNFRISIRT